MPVPLQIPPFLFFCYQILDFTSKEQNAMHTNSILPRKAEFVSTGPDPLLIQINTDLFSLSAFTL